MMTSSDILSQHDARQSPPSSLSPLSPTSKALRSSLEMSKAFNRYKTLSASLAQPRSYLWKLSIGINMAESWKEWEETNDGFQERYDEYKAEQSKTYEVIALTKEIMKDKAMLMVQWTAKMTIVAAGDNLPTLPPSVEEAYRKKCIELRRRTIEVEESNDAYRVRKARLQRGIRKMRLERAYLLEILGKRMNKNSDSVDAYIGQHDEDSEGSSEAPPTPNEKPLRSKRSHRRPVSSPPPPLGHQQHRPLAPSQSHPTSAFEPPRDIFRESRYQHVPTTNGHAPTPHPRRPSDVPSNAISPSGQTLPQAPAPPPTAFDEFLHRYIMPRYDPEEDTLDIAKQAWDNPENWRIVEEFEKTYQQNLGRYNHNMNEFHLMKERMGYGAEPRVARSGGGRGPRGGGDDDDGVEREEMEVESELPAAPPSRDGGAGGFTSING